MFLQFYEKTKKQNIIPKSNNKNKKFEHKMASHEGQ